MKNELEIKTPIDYQKLAARTISDMDPINMRKHSLYGMASEVGEIHGIFQKSFQGHKIDDHEIMEEVGDLLWMISEFCLSFKWTLEEVMEANINKLMKRYPDGFDSERSINRED